MIHFYAWIVNNPYTLSILCLSLVFVPIIGMWAVHKYNWEHWNHLQRIHDVKRGRTEGVAQTTQREDQATEDGQIV
jgi:hypothetical protein